MQFSHILRPPAPGLRRHPHRHWHMGRAVDAVTKGGGEGERPEVLLPLLPEELLLPLLSEELLR